MEEVQHLILLNGSQTVIGVLLTLNVLCIFFDKGSNFIINLLDSQTKRFVERLKRLEEGIDAAIQEFKKSNSYQKIKNIAAEENYSKYPHELVTKAQKLDYITYIQIFSYKITISESYNPIDAIKKYKEQVLAPIFCLVFGLIIFMLDEVAHFVNKPGEIFIFSIFIFTIISYVYWIVIWSTFFLHSATPHEAVQANSWWHKMDEKIGVFGFGILKLLVSVGVSALIIWSMPWDWISSYWNPMWSIPILTVLIVIFPISLLGGFRIYNCNLKGYYSYMHILGHILSFGMFAMCIGILVVIMKPFAYQDLSFLIDVKWLRLAIVVFLMINGLIGPFVLPYIRYSQEYRKKKKEIQITEKNIRDKINEFPTQYDNMCKEIGNTVIEKGGKL